MRPLTGWIWRIGGVVIALWLISVVIITPPSLLPPNESDPKLAFRLRKAVKELNQLKKQNEDIKAVLNDFTNKFEQLGDGSSVDSKDKASKVVSDLQKKLENAHNLLQQSGDRGDTSEKSPSLQHEQTRRAVDNGIQEMRWFFISQLKKIKRNEHDPEEQTALQNIIDDTKDRIRILQYDMESLSNLDGLEEWREKEARDLSDEIQQRLHNLQHPTNCDHARKLLCNLNKGCGYGCQIHHVVYCFIAAYGTKRTLILKSKGWRYNKNGWEEVFKPLSNTCTGISGSVLHAHWPGNENSQVVDLPIIDTLSKRPDFLPLAIPADLSERIQKLHGNPAAWWIGQFLKYMLKPQSKTKEFLDSIQKELQFNSPIVGIHIRRTDKVGTEAAFHSIEEYMEYVADYFDDLAISKGTNNFKRKVYIATDDPSVLTEAQRKFTNYTFLGDPNISQTAAISTRYSDASLKGIIADIHFLSLTDYIVCTFSSQVCRIAYEIMQNLHPDAATKFKSLDDIYYYGGQNSHNQKARFDHVATKLDHMSFKKGDIVGVAGNHWNGYSKGSNRRTRKNALYPSYKMEEVVDVAKMPSYSKNDIL